MSPPSPAFVCLAGPTASGKSAVALEVAERLADLVAIEIVSVDSALVYRGMAIGTAKPGAAERAAVPHHLIDIVEPSEPYSAARFCVDARAAIAAIRGRGALPLLVGGTMLYFKALIDGLDPLPAADRAVRAAIDARAAHAGWPALHAELAQIDPPTAARVAPNDAQRIQRALEVHALTGMPMSAWHTRTGAGMASASASRTRAGIGSASTPQRREGVAMPAAPHTHADVGTPSSTTRTRAAIDPRPASASASGARERPPLIALEPASRAWLYERIDRRFDAMLAAGFVDEVRGLRARGDLDARLPSMRAVGYRQAWQALDSGDLASLPSRATAATRRLAKRQLTWLRAMPWREVVACDASDAGERVVAAVRRIVEARGEDRARAADPDEPGPARRPPGRHEPCDGD